MSYTDWRRVANSGPQAKPILLLVFGSQLSMIFTFLNT